MTSNGQRVSPRRRGKNDGAGASVPSRSIARSPSKYTKSHKKTSFLQGLLNPLNIGLLLTLFGLYSNVTHHFHSDEPDIKWAKTSKDHRHVLLTQPARRQQQQTRAANDNKKQPLTKEYPSAPKQKPAAHQEQQAPLGYNADQQVDSTKHDNNDDTKSATKGSIPSAGGDPLTAGLFKQTPQEQATRHLRFPSVKDRVKVYMSNWYTPPCPENDDALVHYAYEGKSNGSEPATSTATQLLFRELPHTHPEPAGDDTGKVRGYKIGYEFEMARMTHLHRELIESDACAANDYCVDTQKYYIPALQRLDKAATARHSNNNNNNDNDLPIPTLVQWGDSDTPKAYTPEHALGEFPQVPYIMKFRFRYTDPHAIHNMTSTRTCIDGERPIYQTVAVPRAAHGLSYFQPIVWRLTSLRHYGMMHKIPPADVPWHQKKNAAIWRGGLTGIYRNGFKLGMLKSKTPTQVCQMMHRCNLVLSHAASSLVDAQLIGTPKHVPASIGTAQLYAPTKASYADMLQYKAIIMLEGNDISSGLKWALYSNSVVMTQPPTKTSWALEELLEPWVHYVPLKEDLTDVEEKMQWILDHDDEAQEIVRRGSLWVQDLLYHPEVERDDALIYDEMLRRYQAHFVHDPDLVNTLESNHGDVKAKQDADKEHFHEHVDEHEDEEEHD